MRRRVGVPLLGLAAILSACGLGQAAPPTPRAQLDAAVAQLGKVRSVHVTGTYHVEKDTYSLDLELSDGAVVGTARVDQYPSVSVLGRGRQVMIKGAEYFAQWLTSAIGDQWVEGDGTARFLASVDTAGRLALLIDGQTRSFKVVRRQARLGGRKATVLVSDGMSVWITPPDGRVARITSTPGTGVVPVPQLDLALDRYGARVAVPPLPVQPLDLSLPQNATPFFYEVPGDTVSLSGCDAAGCTLSAIVANLGGMLGKTIATLEVSVDRVTALASCQVVLDPIPHLQRETIHCRALFNPNLNVYVQVEFKDV